ncbi:MAG: sugar-binding protein [Armatimonadota bacterium]|nr:sugar-binding protein [Armatimonadota bacterium]
MSRWLRIVLCLTAAIAAACTWAQELGETRVYECKRAAERPVIDGKLTDACWQEAAKTDQFVRVMKGPPEIQQTVFQAAYDDANLYLAVTCMEPQPANIKAAVTARDMTAVMGDDAIEIFIQPDPPEGDYYQLSANSLGTLYDGKAFESGWNATWRAAGSVGEDAWYLECAMAFQSLGGYGAPGAVWGFNVCRDRQAGGQTEWSAWSDTMGGFHSPERFGQLVFAGAATGVNRSLIIESSNYARRSIELEETIGEALAEIEGGLELLPEAEREQVAPTVEGAREALDALHQFLERDQPLDLEGWMRVTERLEASAGEVERAMWVIRFGRLLAD